MQKSTVVAFIIGLVCGAALVWAIAQGGYNKRIDGLTDRIVQLSKSNRDIQRTNTYLRELNTRTATELAGLKQELEASYRKHTSTLERIRVTLSKITGSLTETGAGIQSVIEGIERIKGLVREL